MSGPWLCYLKSDFTTISQKWSPYWYDMLWATLGSLPWRSRSQHDLAAKSCPAHNFVIWSLILQLFHRNDHRAETTYHMQHLGVFYTLNFVCDITLTLQEVYLPVFKTYSESITWFNRLLFFFNSIRSELEILSDKIYLFLSITFSFLAFTIFCIKTGCEVVSWLHSLYFLKDFPLPFTWGASGASCELIVIFAPIGG
jgi:hypothetical protein